MNKDKELPVAKPHFGLPELVLLIATDAPSRLSQDHVIAVMILPGTRWQSGFISRSNFSRSAQLCPAAAAAVPERTGFLIACRAERRTPGRTGRNSLGSSSERAAWACSGFIHVTVMFAQQGSRDCTIQRHCVAGGSSPCNEQQASDIRFRRPPKAGSLQNPKTGALNISVLRYARRHPDVGGCFASINQAYERTAWSLLMFRWHWDARVEGGWWPSGHPPRSRQRDRVEGSGRDCPGEPSPAVRRAAQASCMRFQGCRIGCIRR